MTSLRKRLAFIIKTPALLARLKDASPVREDEMPLYTHVRAALVRQTAAKYAIPEQEAEAEVAGYERKLGARGLLRLLLEPPVILAAPVECVIINGMAAFLVLSVTQHFTASLLTFFLLHMAAVFWYLKQRPRYVAAHLQNFLEKGLEV